jgi:hypothetical protein
MSSELAFVVITSIGSPTEAVARYAEMTNVHVVVVGDRKTPLDWHFPGVDYISPAAQEAFAGRLSPLLPWNHYSRKMLGYLAAVAAGADMIVDTDDDNIPLEGFRRPAIFGEFETVDSPGFVNIYRWFTDEFVWPRGLPLRFIRAEHDLTTRAPTLREVGVWQFLADDDPDVDALYRLIVGRSVQFSQRAPLVLEPATLTPFNSQNTVFHKDAFPLLYLPITVTFRFTDILRSIVAQPILWAANLRLGFGGPTVRQVRNPHDLMSDFESEIPMYVCTEAAAQQVMRAVSSEGTVASNLVAAYEALAEIDIVKPEECDSVRAWVEDLNEVRESA